MSPSHNDRGTAVAAGSWPCWRGDSASRGTLFGNGSAPAWTSSPWPQNLFTHGVDPKLSFSDMPKTVKFYEGSPVCVGYRQPYSGHLVFAAFSGSHQDAISKGMKFRQERQEPFWTVPYLPLDPHDVNREYETDVIRINSQSGKGGISYILEHNFGYDLPKEMAAEVGYFIKGISDHALSSPRDLVAFQHEYQNKDVPHRPPGHLLDSGEKRLHRRRCHPGHPTTSCTTSAPGNGPLDAVSNVLKIANPSIQYQFCGL